MKRHFDDERLGRCVSRFGAIVTIVFLSGWVSAQEPGNTTLPGDGRICSIVEGQQFFSANLDVENGVVDPDAITRLLETALQSDIRPDEARIVDLLAQAHDLCVRSGRRLTLAERWAVIAAAREITGRSVPVSQLRLSHVLDSLEATQAAPPPILFDSIRDRARGVERVSSRDPVSVARQTLGLRYAGVLDALKEIRRNEPQLEDAEATYLEAYYRLIESGQAESVELLDGHQRLEEELASADLSALNRQQRIRFLWDARRAAFGTEVSDLLFSREETMERYEIDRLAIESDPGLTDLEKERQIGARRLELKVELASQGSYISFLDEVRSAVDTELRERLGDRFDVISRERLNEARRRTHAERLPARLQHVFGEFQANEDPRTPSAAATGCDSDPDAIDFEASVDPSRLNSLLGSLGDIDFNQSRSVSFSGVCVNHNINVVASGVIPVGGSFTVTPSPGSLRVDLDLGSLNLGLSLSGYSSSNCSSSVACGFGALCAAEALAVETAISGLSGSINADSVLLTQIADTCVLGDCTAVHPLESNNVSLTNFSLDLFGSCSVLGFDPCALLNSAVTAASDWLLDIASLVEGFFVTQNGDGVLIEVFSNDIVTNGCLPIPEIGQCQQGNPPTQAGLIHRPRGGRLDFVLILLPLSVIAGAVWRRRRRI